MGISHGSVVSYLLDENLNFGMYESGQMSKELLLGIAENARDQQASGITVVWHYTGILYGAVAAILLLVLVNRAAAAWLTSNVSQSHVSILFVLATFSLAANFLNTPIFWLMMGFALPGAVLLPCSSMPNSVDRPD